MFYATLDILYATLLRIFLTTPPALDGYRRHYETPLFVKTISVFLPIAARASTAIYNDRLSRRVDVIDVDQQQTLKVPPFKICANLLKEYWNLSGLRFPTSAPELEAMCKALSVPMTLITDFCFSLDIPVLDLIMPHVCSALAAGTSRLRHIAIQDGDPPVKLVDAITKGCRHLDMLEVSVSSRPTAEAVARAIRGLPALTCINLATSDFRDGTTLVEPIADAIGESTLLAEILITECKLGVNGAVYLFKALRGNTVVRSLDLSDNPDIGDTGACALAELVLLQQKSNKEGVHAPTTLLTRLSLQDTGITTRGALALAEAFAASLQTPYHVELEENRLGREGRFAMFQLKHDLKHVGEFTTDDYDEDEDEDWDADSWDEDSDEEGRDDDDEDDEYDEDGDD